MLFADITNGQIDQKASESHTTHRWMDGHAAKAPGFSVQNTGMAFLTHRRHSHNAVIIMNGKVH